MARSALQHTLSAGRVAVTVVLYPSTLAIVVAVVHPLRFVGTIIIVSTACPSLQAQMPIAQRRHRPAVRALHAPIALPATVVVVRALSVQRPAAPEHGGTVAQRALVVRFECAGIVEGRIDDETEEGEGERNDGRQKEGEIFVRHVGEAEPDEQRIRHQRPEQVEREGGHEDDGETEAVDGTMRRRGGRMFGHDGLFGGAF